MKKIILSGLIFSATVCKAQLSPAITSWLQNTTTIGTYYMNGNSTAVSNGILVGCQAVEYSTDYVYVTATGIPFHPVGPYLDGNPNQAGNQDAIYKFPLNPQPETGTSSLTTMGNIGVFIDGTSVFNFSDGISWKTSTGAWGGNPFSPPNQWGDGEWNRDAIVFEKAGFDCSKGHPAGDNYHHHQNPTAFKTDLQVISNICNLYDADGLYLIDSMTHSPLIGFTYDGYPIYGAYGFKNADGTGGIVRIKSGYQLRNITARTHYADGTDVADGPQVNTTYPLGTCQEDYEWVAHTGEADYLDEHNGRFCVTPEYPNGTYVYFATVDENWNSAYPYFVGPTFYGVWEDRLVSSITESTTTYTPSQAFLSEEEFNQMEITVFPNPASDLIVIQVAGLLEYDLDIQLMDMKGKLVSESRINKGSTIAYFDTQTIYDGIYFVKIINGSNVINEKLIIQK